MVLILYPWTQGKTPTSAVVQDKDLLVQAGSYHTGTQATGALALETVEGQAQTSRCSTVPSQLHKGPLNVPLFCCIMH